MHLVRDERGEPLYVQGFVQDITERKLTEAERDRLRDELLQAQRLESLGRLAGGVAHDFNNMLTAIRGYAELLVGDPNASGSSREHALRIMQAAEQAADLPRQLLAFGRKQILEPAIVDLNDVVSSIGGLLEHVISKSITVVIAPNGVEFVGARRPEPARARARQPRGERERCDARRRPTRGDDHERDDRRARRDRAGRAARVVRRHPRHRHRRRDGRRDAPARVRAVLHDEAEREGSGLGLSSVYGTVAQSGGFVLLDTEVGVGHDVLAVPPGRGRAG